MSAYTKISILGQKGSDGLTFLVKDKRGKKIKLKMKRKQKKGEKKIEKSKKAVNKKGEKKGIRKVIYGRKRKKKREWE